MSHKISAKPTLYVKPSKFNPKSPFVTPMPEVERHMSALMLAELEFAMKVYLICVENSEIILYITFQRKYEKLTGNTVPLFSQDMRKLPNFVHLDHHLSHPPKFYSDLQWGCQTYYN